MINAQDQPDLDDVLASLSTVKETIKEIKQVPVQDLTDENVYNFVMGKLMETINSNGEVLEQTKDLVNQVGTAEYIEAHSSIIKSQSELFKNMVNVVIEKRKMDQAKELKTRDLDIKEKNLANKVPELGNGEGGPITNNFILATRDQIFASMFGSPEDKEKAQQKIKEANNIVIDV